MKTLVFTEGTILMHRVAKGVSRKKRVEQAKARVGSIYDYGNYIPIDDAVKKLQMWNRQGAEIVYLTSRTKAEEIKDIKEVLQRHGFPKGELSYREKREEYKHVAESVMPDIIIEDDCESIGGKKEMTYPHINPQFKKKTKSIVVKEFGGIDHLPNELEELARL